jgi:hypothetical protein
MLPHRWLRRRLQLAQFLHGMIECLPSHLDMD